MLYSVFRWPSIIQCKAISVMFRTQIFSQDDSYNPNLEKVIIRNSLGKELEEQDELNKYLEIKLVN